MQKKIPMRQCVGCREMKPKKELCRVVRSPEGVISLDLRGKAPGRGAYICPDPSCLERARKSKALSRAFEQPVPDEVYAALTEALKEAGREDLIGFGPNCLVRPDTGRSKPAGAKASGQKKDAPKKEAPAPDKPRSKKGWAKAKPKKNAKPNSRKKA